jgi:hypothetical protein
MLQHVYVFRLSIRKAIVLKETVKETHSKHICTATPVTRAARSVHKQDNAITARPDSLCLAGIPTCLRKATARCHCCANKLYRNHGKAGVTH